MKQDLQAAWWSKWMEMGLWFFHVTIPISAGGLPIKTIQESNINTLVQAIFRLNNTCPRRVRRKKSRWITEIIPPLFPALCPATPPTYIHPQITITSLGGCSEDPFRAFVSSANCKMLFPFPSFHSNLAYFAPFLFFSFLLLILQYVLAIKHQYTGFKLKLLSHIRYIHECVCIYIYIYIYIILLL